MKMILGKKIGMTNIFSPKGKFIPVTLVKSGINYVTQIKTEEKEGYNALQIGFLEVKKIKKPQEGHLKKAKAPKLKNLKEVEVSSEEAQKHKIGDKITVSIFKVGEDVNVTGISKGKGFAGVIKRHVFHRGPMTHGSDHHREPGSIGAMFPQRVFKGTKLPGRMGAEQVTVKNLKIEKIEPEENIIYIHGAVPGPNKSLVIIRSEKIMHHEPEEHDLAKERAAHEEKEEAKEHKEEEDEKAPQAEEGKGAKIKPKALKKESFDLAHDKGEE